MDKELFEQMTSDEVFEYIRVLEEAYEHALTLGRVEMELSEQTLEAIVAKREEAFAKENHAHWHGVLNGLRDKFMQKYPKQLTEKGEK